MGIEMLLAAIGMSKEQIAELKALLAPEKIKATLAALAAWRNRMEAMIVETHANTLAIEQRLQRLEMDVFNARQASQGGVVSTPQQERALDAALLETAAEGRVTYTIHETQAEATEYVNGHDSGNNGGSDAGSSAGNDGGSDHSSGGRAS